MQEKGYLKEDVFLTGKKLIKMDVKANEAVSTCGNDHPVDIEECLFSACLLLLRLTAVLKMRFLAFSILVYKNCLFLV